MVEIFFLRHGQTPYNVTDATIGGHSNHLPLTDLGKEQAHMAAVALSNSGIKFDKVFCSDARRARETLACMMEDIDFGVEPIFSDRIIELGQGEWEGHVRSEIFTPDIQHQFNAQAPFFTPPGGESLHDVEHRMMKFVRDEILNKYDSGRFLIVCHGNAIRCFLHGVLGHSPVMILKLSIWNLALTKLRFDPIQGWCVDYINRPLAHDEL